MSKIVVFNSMTLDGVMQAPARPDEDTRGGFQHGGWAIPYSDPAIGQAAGESMATAGGLLLGRRTYEDFYNVWPNRTDNPFTEVLNNSPKYVASRSSIPIYSSSIRSFWDRGVVCFPREVLFPLSSLSMPSLPLRAW